VRDAEQPELDLGLSGSGVPELPARYAQLPFEVLGLSARITRALEEAGVKTLADLAAEFKRTFEKREGVGFVSIRELSTRFHALCNGEFDPTLFTGSTLRDELQAVLLASGLSEPERELRIIERTCGLTEQPPLTLESVGVELGLTRERVRQLKARAESGVRKVLSWLPMPSLSVARRAIRARGGLARLADVASDLSTSIPSTEYDATSYLRWLCSLSSDPTLHVEAGSELIVGVPLGTHRYAMARQKLERLLTEGRSVTVSDVASALAGIWASAGHTGEAMLNSHARLLLEDRAVEVLPGRFSLSRWSRVDYAEWVIAQEGGAMHFQQVATRVNDITGQNYDATGFNTVLNTDPRFVRVGAGDFALASWGAERYGRFNEVIERYLREHEKPIHERQICDDLLGIYTVQEATVIAMLRGTPDTFVHFGGGYWGLRAVEYRMDPELEEQIARQLARSSDPMPIDELRRRITFERGGMRPLPVEDVLRVLYVSPRFRRFGTTTPPRFVLNSAGDAAGGSED
jgi:DNA-directed RNA polymerase delta subunit